MTLNIDERIRSIIEIFVLNKGEIFKANVLFKLAFFS
jgi:hypothetical protein